VHGWYAAAPLERDGHRSTTLYDDKKGPSFGALVRFFESHRDTSASTTTTMRRRGDAARAKITPVMGSLGAFSVAVARECGACDEKSR